MLISLAKEGDFISCEESQVAVFESQGYQRTDSVGKPSQSQPASVSQPVPSGLVRMAKDDLEMIAEPSQVAVFEAQGWTANSAAINRHAETEPLQSQPPKGVQSQLQPQPEFALKDVLLALDPDSDADWTADKLIKLAVLKELTGREVTRAEVNEVWTGFNRDVLRAAQQAS